MSGTPGPQYIRPLQQLRRADEPRFGGKSAGLGELLAAGVPVPPGFAIESTALEDALSGTSRPSADAIAAAEVPEAVNAQVAAGYDELARAVGTAEPPVAVRSSAIGEDSHEATFAGQQDTYLWVRGAGAAVGGVWDGGASLWGDPAIAYRARLGHSARPAMGVAVQLMVDAAISGVMFTCNPVTGDPSMVAINASWGLGAAVVSGDVTPDDYLVSKVTGELVRARIASKGVQCVPRADGAGTELVEVTADLREQRCLDEARVAQLVALGGRLQLHFGCHQDIEWAIARTGELYLLQSRPVTVASKPAAHKPQSALAMVMSTFGVREPGAHGAD
jgi:phosphoenolpyruvate synthase/pyruvate phosphate dikinase